VFAQGSGMGILAGGSDEGLPGGFHMPFFGSTLNVGALVEPLTSQMAEYLGVPNGLMVKQWRTRARLRRRAEGVRRDSEGGARGGDHAVGLGPRAARHQGKPVQVTILRDRKQQTLTLQVDSKHKQGDLELQDLFGAGDGPLVAEMLPDPEFVQQFAGQDEAAAQAMKEQAEKLKEHSSLAGWGSLGSASSRLRSCASRRRSCARA